MQMKRQLTERRSSAELYRAAQECADAGFDDTAELLFLEADIKARRERRPRYDAEVGGDER